MPMNRPMRRLVPILLTLALAGSAPARAALTYANFPGFVDPNPSPGNQFGISIRPLSTGNVVVTAPMDDAGGTNAGAVYLFNGATGELIDKMIGTHAEDHIGSGGVYVVGAGNFVVCSPDADISSISNTGVVSWGSGTTGFAGLVAGSGGDYYGTTAGDRVGSGGVTVLTNGNYVVRSPDWSGTAASAGAATWFNGNSGPASAAAVSASNSIVGSTANDFVGERVVALTNGNYVVYASGWDNGAAVDAGAARWSNGTFGSTGTLSAANAIVGTASGNKVGENVFALTNGAYVVLSPSWDNGATTDVGAVTFGSPTGTVGAVSAANSLVGSSASDQVGSSGVLALTNGNYVVLSPGWNNTAAFPDAGAATWGSGTTGVTGAVSTTNSLYGAASAASVGNNGIALTNGNYVVGSPAWDNGAATNAGAATWCNGTTGRVGTVSAANSIVGPAANDGVGASLVALANGNAVSVAGSWDNGAIVDAGAVTRINGVSGTTGVVSGANSLVGSTAGDRAGAGGVFPLPNGNFVVASPNWDNGVNADAGAVTFGLGSVGVVGPINISNSLVGSHANDLVGDLSGRVVVLANGNYVVRSIYWSNGAAVAAGAVTWGSGTSGISGAITSANSLVGTQYADQLGTAVIALPGGDYVTSSPWWDNGALTDAGAVTWCSGVTGRVGTVDAANSFVGTHTQDYAGQILLAYANGNYLAFTSGLDFGALTNVGAVTAGAGTAGGAGAITTDNSVVGFAASSSVADLAGDPVNGTFVVSFQNSTSSWVRVGPNKLFQVASLADIPADQGGWLRLTFERSSLDHPMANPTVLTYGVWRHVPGTAPALASAAANTPRLAAGALREVAASLPVSYGTQDVNGHLVVTVPARSVALPANTLPPGTWELVATVPAMQVNTYTVAVPTISNLASDDFLVTAHTSNPSFWFTTPSVTGQSVDNVAPAAPVVTLAAYSSGATHLQWNANVEADLAGYNVYRGSSAGFTPSPANRISALQSSTSIVDAGPAGNWYKLSAVDVDGNESAFALVTPSGTTDVASEPVAFALEGVRPNPASGLGVHVAFALPDDARATIELLDVSGRRVVTREVGTLGAGRHVVDLAETGRVAAGIYWVRLTQGTQQRSTRVAVVQ